MIQTQAQLLDFLKLIDPENELAIDTEFKRVNTYYPVLCLLQIASKNHMDCIDILALEDLDPLFGKLYRADCLWIVHAARQDIEALHQLSGQLPKQLFDTQIAACLLGHPMQVSYQALTQSLQNVCLEKAYTRFDWTTRPLPDEAIKYALDDVYYLLKNYHQLRAQLATENKLDWVKEESESLLNIQLYVMPINQAWEKVKGLARINPKAQKFAAQLSAWREHQAQSKNKPRRWILTDETLINHALNKQPLPDKTQQSFDAFLLQHKEIQHLQPDLTHKNPPTSAEKAQKSILQKAFLQKANQYNLAPELLANGKSMFKYIRGDQTVDFCQGWRYHLLEKELEELEICKTV